MFKDRSNKDELLDTATLDENEINTNLQEFRLINRWLGTRFSLLTAVKSILLRYSQEISSQLTVTIADLGCGAGDMLTALHFWGIKNKRKFKLFGFDSHPTIVDIAKKATFSSEAISISSLDILSPTLENYRFDIICINNVCHHFSEKELVRLFQRLKKCSRLGIVVTDLRRHPIPYYFIKYFTKLFKLSFLAQHDGPLSVLKAFKKNELLDYLKKADIQHFSLKKAWGFRWKLIVWCKEQQMEE